MLATHPSALPHMDHVHDRCRSMWEPPRDILPSQWARENLYLRQGSTPKPGELDLEVFQREIVDCWVDPNIHELVFVKPTQIGW